MKKALQRLGINIPADSLDIGDINNNGNNEDNDNDRKHDYRHDRCNNNNVNYDTIDKANDNAVPNVQSENTTSRVASKMQKPVRSAYHYMPLQAIQIQS